jgi:hypothetical protein
MECVPECMLGSEGGPEGTGWEGRERHPTREGFPDSSRTPNPTVCAFHAMTCMSTLYA